MQLFDFNFQLPIFIILPSWISTPWASILLYLLNLSQSSVFATLQIQKIKKLTVLFQNVFLYIILFISLEIVECTISAENGSALSLNRSSLASWTVQHSLKTCWRSESTSSIYLSCGSNSKINLSWLKEYTLSRPLSL